MEYSRNYKYHADNLLGEFLRKLNEIVFELDLKNYKTSSFVQNFWRYLFCLAVKAYSCRITKRYRPANGCQL